MKTILLTLTSFLFFRIPVLACTVCGKQQPKIVRGIAHGSGPQSDWDYLIVGIAVFIVLISLFYSIKWIIRPSESDQGHIKHSSFILE